MLENYFDQRAATWDSNPDRLKLAQAIMNFISRSTAVSADSSVLDYGCGTGLLSVLLSGQVKSVCSADTSDGMLEQLRQKIQTSGITNIAALNLDILKTPLPDMSFDLIVSSMTLHHLENAFDGVKHLSALLKPGGWLALADLCTEDGSFHSDISVGYNGFDPAQLCDFLKDLGFENFASDTVFEIPKNSRRYPVFCICTGSNRSCRGTIHCARLVVCGPGVLASE